MSKKLPKLPCTRSQLMTLAAKHNVTNCNLPLPIDKLNQLGGSWVVANPNFIDTRRYFCRVTTGDKELRLEVWNWPKQQHHSTLVIFNDDTYTVQTYTKEGRSHTPMWNYFMKCARAKHFFKMPKEIEI